MSTAPFELVVAETYEHAAALLAEHGEDARLLAGGQSLVPAMNLRLARPEVLVDLNHVDDRHPEVIAGRLHLPAMTRHRSILEHPVIGGSCPLLADAVGYVGNVRVRNRGTIGGSLAQADPTSELGAASVVLDAELTLEGPGRAVRTVRARDFFVSYLTTVADLTEVVTSVTYPVTGPGQGWSFQEMVRRTSDFAIVAAAVHVEVGPTGVIRHVAMSLAGVADRIVLVGSDLLDELVEASPDDDTLQRVAQGIAASVDPGDDVHASGWYRKRLVAVLARRGLRQAIDRAMEVTP